MFDWLSFLRREVVPALGCTEPGAVALATARAREALSSAETVVSVTARVSDSIYKNGKDVGIPGVPKARGNAVAAALAMLRGNSDDGLELLHGCTPEDVAAAVRWVDSGRIRIERAEEAPCVYVEAIVRTESEEATAIIRDEHARIDVVRLNGQTLTNALSKEGSWGNRAEKLPDTFAELYRLPESLPDEARDYILEGVVMNRAISEAGARPREERPVSLAGALAALQRDGVIEPDLGYRIRTACVAASEFRMSGGRLPVMSSGGSGNAGITAILPVALVAQARGVDDATLAQAIAVSHLVTSYIKARVGRLAPVCGCVVAAGSGAAAGICSLLDLPAESAAESIRMLLSNTAGQFCDGAKESCALKVGTAAHEAYVSSLLASRGARIEGAQGVAAVSVEETIEHIARINAEGLGRLDEVMIAILEERNT